ncbi:haloacid dehalogenase-like hydrolase domain-containing protein [Phthorimaea operculella]|nr:haloacid dehalogenase-like hydrolase domain-containing protein [Phthorimaea operculella]
MSLQGIKLVTFDATNTLLKFKVPPWQHYAAVAREYGFKGTSDDLKHRLLNSYKIMWNQHPNFGRTSLQWEPWWKQVVKLTFDGQLPSQADIEVIATRLIDEFKTTKCWSQAEGGKNLIQLLRNKGITSVGVISNFDPRLVDILKSVRIHDSFDFILTSYETGFSKPDERIFKKALEKCDLGVIPSESLHIGDDLAKDYDAAKSAGWHALIISQNTKTEKPPASDHVFNNLEEVIYAIENDKLKL